MSGNNTWITESMEYRLSKFKNDIANQFEHNVL